MVFALLIAAIIWNLGTWYLGLPASSSHTLIGSIIGVGVANALMHGSDGTSRRRLDARRPRSATSLLLSPLFGFCVAALLLLALKFVVRNPALYAEPEGQHSRRRWWIRGILILTCTGVQLRPRLQRRPEGHGPDHADPDRHGADRLCAEPRDAGNRRSRSSGRLRTPLRRRDRGKGAPATACIGDPRPAVTQLRRRSARSTKAPIRRWPCW